MSETPVADMSFEQAMAELEAVVEQLERGDVALDASIALYERGAALRAHCEARLKAAEEKIAAITLDETGQPTGTQPLAPQAAQTGVVGGADPAAKAAKPGGGETAAHDDEIPF